MTANTIPRWIPPLPAAGTANAQNDLKTIQANIVAGDKPIPLVYGQAQVGGQIFAVDYNAGTWTVGAVLCIGEILSVDSVYLNGATAVAGVTVNTYTGTTAQVADPLLAAAIAGYADTLVMTHPAGDVGFAYVVIQYTESHYSGLPSIIVELRGKKVKATDAGSPIYSESPALAIRDYITNAAYGMGGSVDDTSITALANANAATVLTEPRRLVGLVLDKSQPAEKWLDTLALYAGGWHFKRGGVWFFTADRPSASVATFTTAAMLRDSFKLSTADRSQVPTVVEVAYTDTTTTPWRARTVSRELAGVSTGAVPRRVSRVSMPGLTRHTQAWREAQERLDKFQRGLAIEFVAFDDHLGLEQGDVITVTHPFGITAELFRISEKPGTATPGRTLIRATQYNQLDYDDSETAAPSYGASAGNLGDAPSTGDLIGGANPDWGNITNKPAFGDLSLLDQIAAIDIVDGAVTAVKVSLNAINALGDLAGNTVGSAQIVANAVTNLTLATGAVTASKTTIAAIDPATGNLEANVVSAAQVVAGAITGSKIQSGTITAANIAGLTITASQIAANSITSDKINVGTLSAIAANIGTVTAGNLSTSGYVRAFGVTSSVLGEFSIYGNENNAAKHGIAGESGTAFDGAGVIGGAMASNTQGVRGESNNRTNGKAIHGIAFGSTGRALSSYTTGGAVGLYCHGPMQINNSTLVSNLNAQFVNGLSTVDFHLRSANTITVRPGSGEGGEVVLEGYSSAYDVVIDTTGSSTSTTKWRVHWAGAEKVTVDNSGNMVTQGTMTAGSDRRLKTDLEPISDALAKVGQLSGYTYRRIDMDATEPRHVGLIADEVEAVMPEAVGIYSGDLKSVAYGNLVALLVEAIKTLTTRAAALDDRVKQLEANHGAQ